jgi:hypothetical protein
LKNSYYLIIFWILNIPLNSIAQDSYLCISEASGGVAYNSNQNKWEGTKFKTENEKIILIKKNSQWKLKEFGHSFENDCSEMSEYGILRCQISFGEFIFNSKTKRYLESYILGYIDGKDNNKNTPSVTIGKCSPL